MSGNEKGMKKTNLSRFEIYCEKFGVNPNLIMLKLTLFVMYGGMLVSLINILLLETNVEN